MIASSKCAHAAVDGDVARGRNRCGRARQFVQNGANRGHPRGLVAVHVGIVLGMMMRAATGASMGPRTSMIRTSAGGSASAHRVSSRPHNQGSRCGVGSGTCTAVSSACEGHDEAEPDSSRSSANTEAFARSRMRAPPLHAVGLGVRCETKGRREALPSGGEGNRNRLCIADGIRGNEATPRTCLQAATRPSDGGSKALAPDRDR